MEPYFPTFAARFQRTYHGVHCGQGEYPRTIVTQTNAWVVKVGARHVDPHIDAAAIFGPGVAHLGAGASCCHCAMIHASHACVIHVLHAAMVHSGHSAVVHTAHGRLAGRSVAHSGHATAHCAHHVRHG